MSAECGVQSAECRKNGTARLAVSSRSARWAAVAVFALLASLGCNRSAPPSPVSGPDQPQHLPTATIRVGSAPLVVEVARTREEQAKGMMFRKSLGPEEAMLFVADRDTNLAFWMKNTYVDLDLAFIRSDGVIVQVERMKALSTDPVYSLEPARFTLEVPAGWLAAHGIGAGAKVELPPEAVRPAEPRP